MDQPERERYRRLQDLFQRAIVEPAEALDAFIAREIGDDDELRAELERLLAAHGAAEGFLEPPADGTDDENDSWPSWIGGRVGVYRLLRPLGRGGMGCVYLAARDDDVFRKRVAIKLLRPEALAEATSEVRVRRFHAERQILAGLEHPHIARLLDGGTTDAGLPYLVMEYVEGKPIDVYCDEHRLPTRERLRLFLAVCDAVSFAHRNLVVHRDLKPSNILVKTDGTVKLLDFGIAKLLNPELAGAGLAATTLGARALTPGYASPEQLKGDPISTASDVYSLGVLLYELLSGHRPYRVDAGQPAAMLRAVCEREPPPMSRAVGVATRRRLADGGEEELAPETVAAVRDGDPGKLRRRLEGDLDTIVAKTLRKEPERRYASAERLAEDLERHLGGFPVRARRPTLAYHWGTFVRRNRFKVAAAVAFVLASLSFGLVMGWQRQEILRERTSTEMALTRAEEERSRSQSLADFLVELFSPAAGEQMTARQMLDRGAEKVMTELEDEPELQALAQDTIGMIFLDLAQSEGEYRWAEEMLTAALETRRRLWGDGDARVGESLLHLASLHIREGRYEEAEALHRRSMAATRGRSPADGLALAKSQGEIGILELLSRGDPRAAKERLTEALAGHRRWGRKNLERAEILNNLGMAHHYLGELETAEDLHQQALAIRQEQAGEDHFSVSESLSNLGALRHTAGDLVAARQLYRRALEIRRHALGEGHPRFATVLRNLGNVERDLGEHETAEERYRQALAIQQKALGPDHLQVAGTFGNRAMLEEARQRWDAAERDYREAATILRGIDPEHHELGVILTRLTNVLMRRGAHSEAAAAAREAVGILPASHWRAAAAKGILGGCLVELGRTAEAEVLLREAHDALANAEDRRAERYRREISRHLTELGDVGDRKLAVSTTSLQR